MIKDTYKTFGDYLKDNRNERKMTAAQIADTIGVSRAEISRIETGDRKEPSIRVLRFTTALFGDKMEDVADFLLNDKATMNITKAQRRNTMPKKLSVTKKSAIG
jgi:transcriptional regulator with XRE-family HTH domain